MKVCTAEEMRAADKRAIEEYKIPGIVLMENAAISCVKEIAHFDSFVVVCGKGNNAGDGFAIARHLLLSGKDVSVCLLFGDSFSGDAKINFDILKAMGVNFFDGADKDTLKEKLKNCQCVVDAIFGTGLRGTTDGIAKTAIEAVNEYSSYVLSVDIPSGVSANDGKILGTSVRANKTVTFAAYKRGLLLYPGAKCAGETVVSGISMPKEILKNTTIEILDRESAKKLMPVRYENSHKGDYGKIFIIGGSVGMAGAVCLSARAALNTGAGIVTMCVPYEINDICQKTVTEAMTYPVDFSKDIEKITEKMKGYDVILFGNGIGREKYTEPLLVSVIENSDVPIVIDADGLYALRNNIELLKKHGKRILITPHSAEFGRLTGKTAEAVENDRIGLSCEFSRSMGLTLVLKGNHTIITAPDGTQRINMSGNSGMATAGSGDVLAGMAAALLGQTDNISDGAALAVYLHGAAGDKAAESKTKISMTAGDIVDNISHIIPVE